MDNLPLELLPLILSHLHKPHHLALACRVNKAYNYFGSSKLYREVAVYAWQRDGKTRVIQLFTTLAGCRHLAFHVRRLVIRDFPKGLATDGQNTSDLVLEGLLNCINLRACTWTRDGSLNSDTLRALQKLENLQDLEINGRSETNYDPNLLRAFTHLGRLSIIMPSGPVVHVLPSWVVRTGSALRNLTLICKSSPIITDKILEHIAPHLPNLQHLYLTGCSRVTHRGVWAIVQNSSCGLQGLGMEGLTPRFDIGVFSSMCANSDALSQLKSITLTVDGHLPLETWAQHILVLLSSSPLQNFHIYSTGMFYEFLPTDEFWAPFLAEHATRLLKFSVHRMLVGMQAISEICRRCTALEQLFIVVEPESLPLLSACLADAKSLRSLHVNYPLEAHADMVPVISPHDALAVIQQCTSPLTQLGFNAKVWQVSRTIDVDQAGHVHAYPKLVTYESPDIPEAFLVMRT